MISQGIGTENIQTLEPMGESQMSKGKPIRLSTTHFVFCAQSSKSTPKVVELVNAWGWEEYGSEIRIMKPPIF